MVALILIAIVIAAVTIWINIPVKDEMSNAEYEKLFTKYVYQIDRREPQWVKASLRELKRGYSYYWENPRALSTLELLEETCNGEHPEIRQFILSCNKNRKKKLI